MRSNDKITDKTMLQWDHKYELGHEKIDFEHHIFLNLVIEFKKAVDDEVSNEKLIRIAQEVIKYADFHFLSEENLMIEQGYPDIEAHAKLHMHLLSELRDRLFRLKHGSIAGEDVFEFLFNWFALHTSTEDKKLVGFISKASTVEKSV